MIVHLDPAEQRTIIQALAEQRERQEAAMSQTEQLLRRMTGRITAYMGTAGQRPLRMSAVLPQGAESGGQSAGGGGWTAGDSWTDDGSDIAGRRKEYFAGSLPHRLQAGGGYGRQPAGADSGGADEKPALRAASHAPRRGHPVRLWTRSSGDRQRPAPAMHPGADCRRTAKPAAHGRHAAGFPNCHGAGGKGGAAGPSHFPGAPSFALWSSGMDGRAAFESRDAGGTG